MLIFVFLIALHSLRCWLLWTECLCFCTLWLLRSTQDGVMNSECHSHVHVLKWATCFTNSVTKSTFFQSNQNFLSLAQYFWQTIHNAHNYLRQITWFNNLCLMLSENKNSNQLLVHLQSCKLCGIPWRGKHTTLAWLIAEINNDNAHCSALSQWMLSNWLKCWFNCLQNAIEN